MNDYFMPISELSKQLDVPAHTLRYWEKEFPSIVKPTTGAGGRRYYREQTVENIIRLKKLLYADGFTIDGVKKLIANNQFASDATPTHAQSKKKASGGLPPRGDSPPNGDIKTAIKLLEQAKSLLEK